jgi:regulator of sigma E protease
MSLIDSGANWLLVFFGLSLLIILHEAGHFVAAKATGMRVERFSLFFGPMLISFKRGETEYGIACIPLGGYVKISGMNPEEDLPPEVEPRAYYRQPVWKRIVTIGAGPAVNIVLAFVILFGVFLTDAQRSNQTVGEIEASSPASRVLRSGDLVLAIDGKSYPNADVETRQARFAHLVASHECAGKPVDGCIATTPVTLRIKRDDEVRTIQVRPEYDSELKRTRIGFSYGTEHEALSVGQAAGRAGSAIWTITSKTGSVFAHLTESKQREQVSGIVGVSDVAHQAIDIGIAQTLILFAFISLSLGLINLLPFLPLDGGHIFWSLVEKVRGRPVSFQLMERASVVGIMLMVLLMFIGLSNDIGRLSGEGFKVR